MKGLLGEYGRVVIVLSAVLGILAFLLGAGAGSFSQIIKKPEASYGKQDSEAIVDDIQDREPPTLEIQGMKLSAGSIYDLSDTGLMGISARNADGQELPVTVHEITDKEGRKMDPGSADYFMPERGMYRVVYHTEETYRGAVKAMEETYVFVAD